jgi:hypothetical protein
MVPFTHSLQRHYAVGFMTAEFAMAAEYRKHRMPLIGLYDEIGCMAFQLELSC